MYIVEMLNYWPTDQMMLGNCTRDVLSAVSGTMGNGWSRKTCILVCGFTTSGLVIQRFLNGLRSFGLILQERRRAERAEIQRVRAEKEKDRQNRIAVKQPATLSQKKNPHFSPCRLGNVTVFHCGWTQVMWLVVQDRLTKPRVLF